MFRQTLWTVITFNLFAPNDTLRLVGWFVGGTVRGGYWPSNKPNALYAVRRPLPPVMHINAKTHAKCGLKITHMWSCVSIYARVWWFSIDAKLRENRLWNGLYIMCVCVVEVFMFVCGVEADDGLVFCEICATSFIRCCGGWTVFRHCFRAYNRLKSHDLCSPPIFRSATFYQNRAGANCVTQNFLYIWISSSMCWLSLMEWSHFGTQPGVHPTSSAVGTRNVIQSGCVWWSHKYVQDKSYAKWQVRPWTIYRSVNNMIFCINEFCCDV